MLRMATKVEDHEMARSLRQELQNKTSLFGQGMLPNSDFEQQFQAVLHSYDPSATVIWMAGSMQARHFADGDWARAIIIALEDRFRIKLNEDLIVTQIDL